MSTQTTRLALSQSIGVNAMWNMAYDLITAATHVGQVPPGVVTG
ncbi:MAG: hypothetical protein ACF8AM_20555 [Rhodopirellula sp. JB055]